MMSRYQQGANLERRECHVAISGGALLALRGAGSKSYGKYKIDTIFVFKDKVVLTQYKKSGKIAKRDLVALLELQRKVPEFIEIRVGTTSETKSPDELLPEIFGKQPEKFLKT